MTVMPRGYLTTWAEATIYWLQKWGWILFAAALLILVLCTVHKPPICIPKSQCLPYK